MQFGREIGEALVVRKDGCAVAKVTVERINGEMAYLIAETAPGVEVRRMESADDIPALVSPNGKDVLTTSQVGRLFRVAPRTVSKWFDTGKLKGYRVQADRRIPWSNVVAFAREHGIPIEEYMSTAV